MFARQARHAAGTSHFTPKLLRTLPVSARGSRAFTQSAITLNKPKRILGRGKHVAVPDVDYLGLPVADFAKTLRQQDPYDRIRFTAPPVVRFGGNMSGDYRIDGYLHDALGTGNMTVSKHLLPCYCVHFYIDRYLNITFSKKPQSHWRTSGMTWSMFNIAAVGKEHWAHGALLFFYSNHELSSIALGAVEGNETYQESLLYDGRFDGNVPLFALAPPALGRGAADRIRQMQRFLRTSDARLAEAPEAKGEPMAYSFPHYRVIYKVVKEDGGTHLFDPAYILPSPDLTGSTLDRVGPHYARARLPGDSGGWAVPYFRGSTTGDEAETGFSVLDEAASREFHDVVLQTMQNEMLPQAWENPHMFPLNDPTHKRAGEVPVTHHWWEVVVQKNTDDVPPPPLFFTRPPPPPPELSPHLLMNSPPPKRPVRPTQKPPAAPVRTPLNPNLFRSDQSRHKVTRNVNNALRDKVQQQQQQQASARTTRRNAHERRLAGDGPLPTGDALHDYKGCYGVLDLEPRPEYLIYARAKDIDNEIRARYLEESFAAHPDKGGSTEAMAKINLAYEKIETVARRIAYHNKTIK